MLSQTVSRFLIQTVSANPSGLKRFLFAVVAVSLTLLITAFSRSLISEALFSINLLAVVASTLYGGRRAGLFAALLSAVGLDFFFIEPVFSVFDSAASFYRVGFYGFIAFVMSTVVHELRRLLQETEIARGEADRARAFREEVLAVIAHDLRNPLATITLVGGVLQKQAQKRAEISEPELMAIHRLQESSRRMDTLIENLLDVAKMETGRLSLRPRSCDLQVIAGETLQMMRPQADEKKIELRLETEGSSFEGLWDESRLVQVLANLLGNSLKYTQARGVIELRLNAGDEWIFVEIRDNGSGISPEKLPHVFERYWQAEGGSRQGAGLGLFIVKSIVDAHGGQIEVRSELGQGSTFAFKLPRNFSEKVKTLTTLTEA
ncbi:MAG: HAMP domain-containing histidine kinase [Methylotenera sp.]|nr:HAMP domain-containing histidine kinase [Oligoflexia bacterium]